MAPTGLVSDDVAITFRVHAPFASSKERVWLLGSLPELGEWISSKAIESGQVEGEWKVFQVRVRMPVNVTFQWAWCTLYKDGRLMQWESTQKRERHVSYYSGVLHTQWGDPTLEIFNQQMASAQLMTERRVKRGDVVGVVGSSPLLGAWDPARAVLATEFPLRSGHWTVNVFFNADTIQEWNWVVLNLETKMVMLAEKHSTRFLHDTHGWMKMSVPWNKDAAMVDWVPLALAGAGDLVGGTVQLLTTRRARLREIRVWEEQAEARRRSPRTPVIRSPVTPGTPVTPVSQHTTALLQADTPPTGTFRPPVSPTRTSVTPTSETSPESQQPKSVLRNTMLPLDVENSFQPILCVKPYPSGTHPDNHTRPKAPPATAATIYGTTQVLPSQDEPSVCTTPTTTNSSSPCTRIILVAPISEPPQEKTKPESSPSAQKGGTTMSHVKQPDTTQPVSSPSAQKGGTTMSHVKQLDTTQPVSSPSAQKGGATMSPGKQPDTTLPVSSPSAQKGATTMSPGKQPDTTLPVSSPSAQKGGATMSPGKQPDTTLPVSSPSAQKGGTTMPPVKQPESAQPVVSPSTQKGGATMPPGKQPDTTQPVSSPSAQKGGTTMPPVKQPESAQPVVSPSTQKGGATMPPGKPSDTTQPVSSPSAQKGGTTMPPVKQPESAQPVVSPSTQKGGATMPPGKQPDTTQPVSSPSAQKGGTTMPPVKQLESAQPVVTPSTQKGGATMPPGKQPVSDQPVSAPSAQKGGATMPPDKQLETTRLVSLPSAQKAGTTTPPVKKSETTQPLSVTSTQRGGSTTPPGKKPETTQPLSVPSTQIGGSTPPPGKKPETTQPLSVPSTQIGSSTTPPGKKPETTQPLSVSSTQRGGSTTPPGKKPETAQPLSVPSTQRGGSTTPPGKKPETAQPLSLSLAEKGWVRPPGKAPAFSDMYLPAESVSTPSAKRGGSTTPTDSEPKTTSPVVRRTTLPKDAGSDAINPSVTTSRPPSPKEILPSVDGQRRTPGRILPVDMTKAGYSHDPICPAQVNEGRRNVVSDPGRPGQSDHSATDDDDWGVQRLAPIEDGGMMGRDALGLLVQPSEREECAATPGHCSPTILQAEPTRERTLDRPHSVTSNTSIASGVGILGFGLGSLTSLRSMSEQREQARTSDRIKGVQSREERNRNKFAEQSKKKGGKEEETKPGGGVSK